MTDKTIARAEVLALRTLTTGAQDKDSLRLNANEAYDVDDSSNDARPLNRYPELRPTTLSTAMAALYQVPTNQLLVTRGSSEAIDILIRCYCRAQLDNVLVMPPTFELYRFFAQLQGAETIAVPLTQAEDFALNMDRVQKACTDETKIVFLCTPNNPTGNLISHDDIVRIADARRGKSIIVVDEAYIEFSDQPSFAAQVDDFENVVVLRTLSKAHALAGARCGAAIANPEIIDLLSRVLPPFSFPSPVIDRVEEALTSERLAEAATFTQHIVNAREKLFNELQPLPCVDKVWPGQGNFLLMRLHDQPRVLEHLKARRILILGYTNKPGLDDCARTTIGSPSENEALVEALRDFG